MISESRAIPMLRRIASTLLIALPLLSLFLNAVGWLRFGLDLPFFDDWRAYATGQIDSLAPTYLFMGINDTMAPVGFALDAIAQRTLDGNSVLYQLLSMTTVLGLLLLLQWKLLYAALGNRIQTAGCFVFTLLMLQPGSYWGRENLAYHQALPLVFLLTTLWLITVSTWKNRWRVPAIFALGMLAGFTYISGAFGALSAAGGIIAMAFWTLPAQRRGHLVQGAAALAAAGVITAATQFKVGVLPTMHASHRGGARLALPYEPDFWLFSMGKIGRSLLLPQDMPVLSLVIVLVVCAAALGLGYGVLKKVRADPDGPHVRVAAVYVALASIAFVYLLLVAAGRTYLRGPEVVTALDVFVLGFYRFHFFWVTLLWPWLVATGLVLARNRRWFPGGPVGAWLLCAASVFMMLSAGALAHIEHHRMEVSYRIPTVTCLMAQLQQGDGIDCPEFNLPDFTPAYIYARRIGASFVRYFPILPLKVGVDDPAPWFRMSRDASHMESRNVSRGPAGYQAGSDAQFLIHTGRPGEMANCVMLDVTAVLSAEHDDTVQVFFRRFGDADFSEANSRVLPLRGHAGPFAFAFQVESDTGFDDMLRLDPVNTAQPFVMTEVEVRCRLRYSTRPFFVLKQPPDRLLSGQTPQLVDSAWLDPVAGDPYGYRAGIDAQVTFKTDKPLLMALCSVLQMEAKIKANQKGLAQVYFLARGKTEFSEASSSVAPVVPAPDGEAQALLFRLESRTGFEDKVRFDPIDSPQDIRIFDVKLSCQRRVGSTLASPVRASAAGPSEKP